MENHKNNTVLERKIQHEKKIIPSIPAKQGSHRAVVQEIGVVEKKKKPHLLRIRRPSPLKGGRSEESEGKKKKPGKEGFRRTGSIEGRKFGFTQQ